MGLCVSRTFDNGALVSGVGGACNPRPPSDLSENPEDSGEPRSPKATGRLALTWNIRGPCQAQEVAWSASGGPSRQQPTCRQGGAAYPGIRSQYRPGGSSAVLSSAPTLPPPGSVTPPQISPFASLHGRATPRGQERRQSVLTAPKQPKSNSIDKGLLVDRGFGRSVEDVYELEPDKIGQGTFGVVRRAKHRMTGIAKAVKVIEKAKVKDPRQLRREVENMRQLDHPHIVRLYETFEDATTVQLVLELCGGGELFHAITKVKRFPERETAIIMDQMLRALHYMHTLHICHRDLKPENFLFMTTQPIEVNVLKLIDFGLSCRCKPPEVLKEVVGTASYVAPQVLMRNYDKQCDLWSCGIIMYIMLCGHPPFRGKNQAELLLKVRDGSFVFDAKVWRTVTRGAKNLITMLLKRDPEERHTTEKALNDPWLLAAAPKNSALLREAPLRDVLVQELRSFSAENRLKKAALHVISRQLSDEHTRELQDIFRALDADSDGMLSLHDLREGLALWGVPEDIPDLEFIMDGLDLDGTGYVDYTEFLAAAVDKERSLNKDVCMCAFNIFDSDGDGKITNGDLRTVLDKGSLARDVAGRRDALVKDVARNGDGTIDFEDFMAMLTKPSGMSTAASEMGP